MNNKPGCAAALLLAAAVCPSSFASEAARLVPGARGITLSALQGNVVQEIPLTYLGTYKDFAGPGYDLHLVQLEGPIAERVGVASGMSGSPVYIEGRLIGALAYRLGSLPKDPIAGVTPIEVMLEAGRGQPLTPPRAESTLAPIATPVLVGGMRPEARQWLADHLQALNFVTVAGGGAGMDPAEQQELGPGSPVGVELLRGDLRVAATGTVTWVDQDLVYAFGHPFFGSGRVEMPMVTAEVIHTMADLAGSLKLANVGTELGAFVEDRWTAIVGRKGLRARMIPMSLVVRGGDYGEQHLKFELVQNSTLAPLLAGAAVANSLQINSGYSQRSTLLAKGTVRLRGLPDLPIEMAFAGDASFNASLGIAGGLLQTLGSLWRNPFSEVEIEALDLEVDVRPEEVRYRLEELQYDRRPLRPGQQLQVRCVLSKFRGEQLTRELTLTVPSNVDGSHDLVLVVGSPEQVDRALGQPLQQRLRSVTDLASLVRVLGHQGSAHRLRGVLHEPGHAVVSRGVVYDELPPTVERLLSSAHVTPGRPRRDVSELGSSEVQLDGPLEGALQVRLRVEGGTAAKDATDPRSPEGNEPKGQQQDPAEGQVRGQRPSY